MEILSVRSKFIFSPSKLLQQHRNIRTQIARPEEVYYDSHDLRNKSRPIEFQASERITTLRFPKDLTVEVESTVTLKHQDENLRYCNGGHILHAPTNRKFEDDILMIHNCLTLTISREEYPI